MPRDYRRILAAKGVKRLQIDKLRTVKEPGTLEIVRDWRSDDGWRLHRYASGMID